jgi:hypothetical protein
MRGQNWRVLTFLCPTNFTVQKLSLECSLKTNLHNIFYLLNLLKEIHQFLGELAHFIQKAYSFPKKLEGSIQNLNIIYA